MKILGRILLILVILVALLFVFKNAVIRAAVVFGAKKAVDLDVGIGSLDVNLSDTFVEIKDFQVDNPEGFPEERLINIPHVYVDYVLGDILKGNIHLPSVKLHLQEFNIIRNREGQLNLTVIQNKLAKEEAEENKEVQEAKTPEEKQEKAKAAKQEIQIDSLELKIEKVYYKDYTVGEKPLVQEFDVNINENFQNITDPESLVRIIVSRALANSTLARLTNLNPQEFLQSNVLDTMTMANQAVTQMGDKAVGTLEETVGGTVGKATEDLKGTADAVVSQLKGVKLPFGAKKSEETAAAE